MSYDDGNSGSVQGYPNEDSNNGRLSTNRSRSFTRLPPIDNSQQPQHPQFQLPRMGMNGQHRPTTQPPGSTQRLLDRVFQQDKINVAQKKMSSLVRRQNLPHPIFEIKKPVILTFEEMVLAAYDKLNPGGAQLHFKQIVKFIRRKFLLEPMIRYNIEFEVNSTLTRMIRKGILIQSYGTPKYSWKGLYRLVSPDRGFGLNLTLTGESVPETYVSVPSGQALPGPSSYLCRTASTNTIVKHGPQRNAQTLVKPKWEMMERFYRDPGLPSPARLYSQTNDLITNSFEDRAGKPILKESVSRRSNIPFSENSSQRDESGRGDFQSRPRTAKAKAKAKTGKELAGDGPSRQRASSHRRIVSPVYDTKSCGRIPPQFRNTMDRQTALDMRGLPQMSEKECHDKTNAINERSIKEHRLITGHSGYNLRRHGTAGCPETAVRPRTAVRSRTAVPKGSYFSRKSKFPENAEDDILAAEADPAQSEAADINANSEIPEDTNPACVDNYTYPEPSSMGESPDVPIRGPNCRSISKVKIEEFLRGGDYHDLCKSQTNEVKETQKVSQVKTRGGGHMTKGQAIQKSRRPKSMKVKRDWSFEELCKFRVIGEGSFGTVYSVRTIATKERVAVKAIRMIDLKDGDTIEGIILESSIQGSARHPNVIPSWGTFYFDCQTFIVMQFCPGGDLQHLILNTDYTATPADDINKRAKDFTRQIVSAVSYLHSELGYIHMDLKPQNVLMAGPDWVKVTDFGCAVPIIAPRHVHPDKDFRGGTPAFFPPEILLAKEAYFDSTVDVWSIGCIAYELLTKFRPFFPMEDRSANEVRDARIALRKMKKAFSTKKFHFGFYDKLPGNQEAHTFFRHVFVPRPQRPLADTLDQLFWLK